MIRPGFLESNNLLTIGGAVVAAFSLVMGLLVLFVIPGACSFLAGLEMLILGLFFVGGLVALLLGLVFKRRRAL